jgi:cbb3-type cytochrome oxidase subunit 3
MFEPYQLTVVVMWVAFLAVLYWVIRLAVRHAIRDADKRRQGQQP